MTGHGFAVFNRRGPPVPLRYPTQLAWWEPASVLGTLSHRTHERSAGLGSRGRRATQSCPRGASHPLGHGHSREQHHTQRRVVRRTLSRGVGPVRPYRHPGRLCTLQTLKSFQSHKERITFCSVGCTTGRKCLYLKAQRGRGGHAFQVRSGTVAAVAHGVLGPWWRPCAGQRDPASPGTPSDRALCVGPALGWQGVATQLQPQPLYEPKTLK